MSINWSQVGSITSGLVSALSTAGVSSANMPSILQQIGLLQNPNESAELAICQQILLFSNSQPGLVAQLAMKLATEQGIPPDAATLALSLGQPGVDVAARVLQIEQLIKQGG